MGNLRALAVATIEGQVYAYPKGFQKAGIGQEEERPPPGIFWYLRYRTFALPIMREASRIYYGLYRKFDGGLERAGASPQIRAQVAQAFKKLYDEIFLTGPVGNVAEAMQRIDTLIDGYQRILAEWGEYWGPRFQEGLTTVLDPFGLRNLTKPSVSWPLAIGALALFGIGVLAFVKFK